jgi:cytochrome bd-type quinol oxidase subunit 2
MTPLAIIGLAVAAVAALVYQSYVTIRVRAQESYSARQKALQIALVWFLPVLGAAVVHAFFTSDSEIPVRPDERFIPEVGHDGGVDGGGH